MDLFKPYIQQILDLLVYLGLCYLSLTILRALHRGIFRKVIENSAGMNQSKSIDQDGNVVLATGGKETNEAKGRRPDGLVYDPEFWEIVRACEEKDYKVDLVEVAWPAEPFSEFTVFPELPYEIRRSIWEFAHPSPCIARLRCSEEPVPGTRVGQRWHSAYRFQRNNSPAVEGLLYACKESRAIFLQRYISTIPSNIRLATKQEIEKTQIPLSVFSGYIDPKVDTLLMDKHLNYSANRNMSTIYYSSDMAKDSSTFAQIQNCAITLSQINQWKNWLEGPLHDGDRSDPCIHKILPNLRRLTFVLNVKFDWEHHQFGELIDMLAKVDNEFVDSLSCHTYKNYGVNRRGTRLEVSTELHGFLSRVLDYAHSWRGKHKCLDRVQIDFAIGAFFRADVKDDMIVRPKHISGSSEDCIYYTSAPRTSDTVRFDMWLENPDLPCAKDGSLFSRYDGIKELFEEDRS